MKGNLKHLALNLFKRREPILKAALGESVLVDTGKVKVPFMITSVSRSSNHSYPEIRLEPIEDFHKRNWWN